MGNDEGVLHSTARGAPADVAGDGSDAPWYVNDPGRWGHIQGTFWDEGGAMEWTRFPEGAVAEARSAHVELRGRIAPTGELMEATCSSPQVHADDFAAAVRDVAHKWRFYPGIGRDGLPVDEPLLFVVWFGYADDGKPTMSAGPVGRPGEPDWNIRWLRRKPFEIGYPKGIRRLDHDVVVYTRFEIDPGGKVVAIAAHRFPAIEAAGEDPFVAKVRRIISERNFGATGKAWAACYDVWFRAKNVEPVRAMD